MKVRKSETQAPDDLELVRHAIFANGYELVLDVAV